MNTIILPLMEKGSPAHARYGYLNMDDSFATLARKRLKKQMEEEIYSDELGSMMILVISNFRPERRQLNEATATNGHISCVS